MANTAAAKAFSLGNLSKYSAGGGIPEGDYCWKDLTITMHQYTKADGSPAGPSRLGVMITMVPLTGGEDLQQFYPLGSKAHESWAPNPETGKGIVPVPGGPGTPPNRATNWAVLLKSLADSGLPEGIFDDDVSVLEGMWVHMANVPEPEERKGYASKTGEAAEQTGPKTIPVVTEIKDDGKPWEGTGGIPAEAPAPKGAKVAPGPKAVATPSKPVGAAKPKVAAASTASSSDDESLVEAAQSGITTVLEKSPNGCPKLILQTGTFKAVKTKDGEETAQAVINKFFTTADSLNSILNPLGYKLEGMAVKPA